MFCLLLTGTWVGLPGVIVVISWSYSLSETVKTKVTSGLLQASLQYKPFYFHNWSSVFGEEIVIKNPIHLSWQPLFSMP